MLINTYVKTVIKSVIKTVLGPWNEGSEFLPYYIQLKEKSY